MWQLKLVGHILTMIVAYRELDVSRDNVVHMCSPNRGSVEAFNYFDESLH